MIDRYSRPHLKAIWEPARKYETWLKVELLACDALAKKGLIPPSAVKQIRAKARIKPARIEALERVTKHDVIAFLESISEQVGPEMDSRKAMTSCFVTRSNATMR